MNDFNRRDALKVGAGAVAGAAIVANAGEAQAQAANELKLTPEKGAKLRVLRPSKFVQGDETVWLENTKKYQQMTGVERRRGPRRQRGLGRPASKVGGGRKRGPRPRHRLRLVRRRASVPRQAAEPQRRL
jgi:multiple sugar transport system substrate-binding protein